MFSKKISILSKIFAVRNSKFCPSIMFFSGVLSLSTSLPNSSFIRELIGKTSLALTHSHKPLTKLLAGISYSNE